MRKITDKEFNYLINKPTKDRYIYTIKEIVAWENVWVLRYPETYNLLILSDENDENLHLPIWPFEEYANYMRNSIGSDFLVSNIELDEFMEELLPRLIGENISINVFKVDKDPLSASVTAKIFLQNLENESLKYI